MEAGVPADHPIHGLRILVDTILRELSDLLDTRHADAGRPSNPSERILRASLVQVVYSVRSERLRRVVRPATLRGWVTWALAAYNAIRLGAIAGWWQPSPT
ncbi:hypothetical protein PproGo58_07530 [Pseudomonas protegens]|nr:hypothetical protein PproGo58_07530 [Pseudomonas protegens]